MAEQRSIYGSKVKQERIVDEEVMRAKRREETKKNKLGKLILLPASGLSIVLTIISLFVIQNPLMAIALVLQIILGIMVLSQSALTRGYTAISTTLTILLTIISFMFGATAVGQIIYGIILMLYVIGILVTMYVVEFASFYVTFKSKKKKK